jgi:hypothetical protein
MEGVCGKLYFQVYALAVLAINDLDLFLLPVQRDLALRSRGAELKHQPRGR